MLELLGDVFLHALSESRRRRSGCAAFGLYLLGGGVVGWATLLIFPDHFIRDSSLRIINLAVTPLAVATLMGAIGYYRSEGEKRVMRLEQPAYAYAFASALAVVRFFLAN